MYSSALSRVTLLVEPLSWQVTHNPGYSRSRKSMHLRISRMKGPFTFTAMCLMYTTSRATASHAVDSWKAKGGLLSHNRPTYVQNPVQSHYENEKGNENENEIENEKYSFQTWEAHDTGLHSFLKESIPEALAHTGP